MSSGGFEIRLDAVNDVGCDGDPVGASDMWVTINVPEELHGPVEFSPLDNRVSLRSRDENGLTGSSTFGQLLIEEQSAERIRGALAAEASLGSVNGYFEAVVCAGPAPDTM